MNYNYPNRTTHRPHSKGGQIMNKTTLQTLAQKGYKITGHIGRKVYFVRVVENEIYLGSKPATQEQIERVVYEVAE